MERKSERIMEQKRKMSSNIINQLSSLIQNVCFLEEKEKIIRFIQIYQLINNNFDLLYEQKKCISFFYIVFQKKQEIKTFLENEIKQGKKIRKIANQFFQQSKLFDNNFLQLIELKCGSLNEKNNFCPICLEIILKKENFLSICNHCYHKKCVLDQLKHSNFCPLCRRDILHFPINS